MTMLEKFISFAQALPEDRREAMEETLAALMESYSSEHEFSDEELAELDRRVAEPSPQFASDAEIIAIFGKSFRE